MLKRAFGVILAASLLISCQKKNDLASPAPSPVSATTKTGSEKYFVTFYYDGGKSITFDKVAALNLYNAAARNLQVKYNTDKDTGAVTLTMYLDQPLDNISLPYQLSYTDYNMDPAPVSIMYEQRTDPAVNAYYTSYSSPSVFRKSSEDGHISVLNITSRTAISVGGTFKGSMKQVFPQASYMNSMNIDSARFNVAFARQ